MKTIQMTLEESLLQEVDNTIKQLDTSRSAFLRDAIREALRKHRIHQMEARDRRGYEEQPQQLDELILDVVWTDEWSDDDGAG